MSKINYIIRRAVISVFLIFLMASVLFLFFRLLPGDYATLLIQSGMSPEQAAEVRENWGLNDPLYVQYIRFLGNMISGDAGISRATNLPVLEYVGIAMFNSIILVAPAITTAFVLGSLYGALIGSTKNAILEKFGIIPPTIIGAAPAFFIGIALIFVFASWMDLLPTGGLVSIESYTEESGLFSLYFSTDFLTHYVLPFMTIVISYFYYPAIVMRGSVVEVGGQDFSYFHRVKGLSPFTRYRHILRHASLPVVTLFPTSMARALSGMVLVEVVFNWPGVGKLLIDSVLARDTPVVQFIFILVAVWIIVGNFVVDILYTVIDPRIAIAEGE